MPGVIHKKFESVIFLERSPGMQGLIAPAILEQNEKAFCKCQKKLDQNLFE